MVFLVILGTFFLSGIAGLLYQVVWTRYLALFLGHTSYAVVAVLAAFMGGLALGNAWLGAVADRVRRPLLFYAGLELGIGLFALFFPVYYGLVEGVFLGVVRATQVEGAARLTVQFVCAAITILLPTVLMGATLPALTKFVTRSLAELRGKVAALYAINSTGAVVGIVLADWWWIPSFGLELTIYFGAAMSLGIGLVALVLSKQEAEFAEAPAQPSAATETFTPAELKLALVGIGVSGFVAILYEIAWTRVLGLALGSSTHAYSLMLATFISGIAAGGWIIYRWRTQAHTLTAFAVAEIALGLTLAASLWFYDLLPWWFSRLNSLLARRAEAYPLYELLQALLCLGVMFIPAVCLGMTLPLVSRVATAELNRTGRSVGRVFAVNTLGTVLGAVLTGLFLLPRLGLAATFALGILLNLAVGLAILGRNWRGPRSVYWLGPAAAMLFVIASAVVLGDRWRKTFTLGMWRNAQPPRTLAEYRAQVNAVNLAYHRDGAGSTVVVTHDLSRNGEPQVVLRVNGKADATSHGDLSTQVLAAHVPMLLRPESPDVLVVGLGSGVTVGSALQHPTTRRVDAVEISPEVVEAAGTHFAEANLHALKDPRTHMFIEDAKTFLKTTSRQYDIIVTEPSNPWMAGVAAVFSREYYEDCRSRLKPGGLIAQWVQAYESSDAIFDIVIATFSSVFPEVGLWQTSSGDLLLIGALQPHETDLGALAARMADPKVAADLGRVDILRVPAFLALEHIPLGHGAYLPEPDTVAHSDYVPVLEYAAQRGFFARGWVRKPFTVSEQKSPRPRTLLGRWLTRVPLDSPDYASLAACFHESFIPEVEVARSAARGWMSLQPTNTLALQFFTQISTLMQAPDAEYHGMAQRPEFQAALQQANLPLLRQLSDYLMGSHRAQRSALYVPDTTGLMRLLTRLVDADPEFRRIHRMRLAEVHWDRGEDDRFLEMATRGFAAPSEETGPPGFEADLRTPRIVLARMLDLFGRRGDLPAQQRVFQEALAGNYLGETSSYREPLLEYEARKVAARLMPAGAQ